MENVIPFESVHPGFTTLPCVVCDKGLEKEVHGFNQPDEASSLRSRGHYGDIFFDPDDGSEIEVNICAQCMQTLWDAGKVCYYPNNDHTRGGFVKDTRSSGG